MCVCVHVAVHACGCACMWLCVRVCMHVSVRACVRERRHHSNDVCETTSLVMCVCCVCVGPVQQEAVEGLTEGDGALCQGGCEEGGWQGGAVCG